MIFPVKILVEISDSSYLSEKAPPIIDYVAQLYSQLYVVYKF